MSACWHCGNRVPDGGGFCRICGRDMQGPPRPPTAEEQALAGRWRCNAPTYASTINTRVPAFLDDC